MNYKNIYRTYLNRISAFFGFAASTLLFGCAAPLIPFESVSESDTATLTVKINPSSEFANAWVLHPKDSMNDKA